MQAVRIPLRTSYPAWIAPAAVVDRATADGILTRRELLSMASRIETVATDHLERRTNGALSITASGVLPDGRPLTVGIESVDRVTRVDLGDLGSVEAVTADDLVGSWENSVYRIRFDLDGTFTMGVTRPASNGWAIAPDASDNEFVGGWGQGASEGT